MGLHQRKITTHSADAQRYFSQGLNWYYAFNHDEATRSFSAAAEIDPDCAMAHWGVALSRGPNYNDSIMTDERNESSWSAMQKALEHISNTTPVERALIEALSHRYANPAPEDRAHLDRAYADAMAEVWGSFPDDSDVGTLYAEAMMILRPWKLYSMDHEPAENTPTIVAVLESVMKIDPGNPGAYHLYIHAVEPSAHPEQALTAADRLSDMVPDSGHLLHMPSHIYVKTGKWDRSIEQNARAMRADERYRALSPEQEIQHMYMVHNAHMLAYSAMMSGREREAMAAARAMWTSVSKENLKRVGPFLDRWMCSVYDVQKRFGRWDDLLAEPAPPAYLPITNATWRAHRAIAFAAKKDIKNAEREYEEFKKARAAVPPDTLWGRDSADRVLSVSDYFVQGEIALHQGDWTNAIELLKKSAEIEDTLGYGEPPQWLQPVRHTLGAVYLKTGRYADAERVYREDLATWENNGWSLYGLSRALRGQGKTKDADVAKHLYLTSWNKSDELTTTSCKCIPKT